MVTKNPRYTQPELGIGHGTARAMDPVDHVAQGAAAFAASKGRTYDTQGLDTKQVDPQRGHAQYLSYRDSMKVPPSATTRESYHAMRTEVGEQFAHMTAPPEQGGMGLTMEVTADDPYPDPKAMAADVRDNKRIKVMSTATTGGHAYFTNEENDQFRAVHDVFGHAGIGRGFSRHGEEAAYLSHAQMFSDKAKPALASETRGQNSYLNYGPGGFPDNGMVDMPQWTTESGPLPTPKKNKPKPQGKQGTLF